MNYTPVFSYDLLYLSILNCIMDVIKENCRFHFKNIKPAHRHFPKSLI